MADIYFHKLFKLGLSLILLLNIVSCSQDNPRVLILTELGTIELELYPDKAPETVRNFLQYVLEERFQEATFYRTVHFTNQPDSKVIIQVIQGGLFEDEHPDMLPAIAHESTNQTGILHEDGVISMARYGPGTATSEFFICVGDQPSLDHQGDRNPDGFGFAAFGQVVKGMDVVRKIHQSPAEGQYLDPRIRILEVIMKP